MEERLLAYLEQNGILLCNRNPYMPALEDIGCGWGDMTALLDRQELFYCKVFRGRTPRSPPGPDHAGEMGPVNDEL